MKMRLKVMLLALLLVGCKSSTDNRNDDGVQSYVVENLASKSDSIGEVFSRVEPIVLEANDSCFVTWLADTDCLGDTILTFDRKSRALYVFDPDGRFVRQIGKPGTGPEEYLTATGFALNRAKRMVSVICPMGYLYNYNLEGKFIDKIGLPKRPNYHHAQWLDGKTLALWSYVDEKEPSITVFDQENDSVIYEGEFDVREAGSLSATPLFNDGGRVYCGSPFNNEIKEVGIDGVKLAYFVDLGKVTNDSCYFENLSKLTDAKERTTTFKKDMAAGMFNYEKFLTLANQDYLYLWLRTNPGTPEARLLSVFINKNDGSSTVIDNTPDGMRFSPIYMNDEYMLAEVDLDFIDAFSEVFGWNLNVTEDDNSVLAKMYFKK